MKHFNFTKQLFWHNFSTIWWETLMVLLCLSFVQKKVTMLYSSPTDKVEKFDFWNFSALVTQSSICSSFDKDWHRCLNKEPLRTETAMSISNKTQNGLSFRFWICYWKLLLMLKPSYDFFRKGTLFWGVT